MMWAVNEDLDRNEREHDELREALEKLDSRLQSINRVLVGLLVSVATASVLLAVNIAILGAGP